MTTDYTDIVNLIIDKIPEPNQYEELNLYLTNRIWCEGTDSDAPRTKQFKLLLGNNKVKIIYRSAFICKIDLNPKPEKPAFWNVTYERRDNYCNDEAAEHRRAMCLYHEQWRLVRRDVEEFLEAIYPDTTDEMIYFEKKEWTHRNLDKTRDPDEEPGVYFDELLDEIVEIIKLHHMGYLK